MVQTTTITVGANAPTTTTTSTNTLTASTNTTTSTDADGIVTTTTITIEFDANLIYTGQAIIGPFDGVTVVMNAEEQTTYDNPQAWLYQSGTFVANSAWPAMELAQAQQAQIAALEAGMNATFNAGFSSSAISSTAITFPFDSASQVKWSWLQGVVNSTTSSTFPTNLTVKDASNNKYTVTYAQAQQLVMNAMTFYLAQTGQFSTLEDDVLAATTVSAVQAIVWSPAT
jgi:hypothetical protein